MVDGDQELSRRYLSHDAVEDLKGKREYEEDWDALGFEPPDWTAAEREEERKELIAEFGKTFLRDYGWAAPLFNDTAPKFKQLQEHVELDHWSGYYRMASHGTHANSKGITWNIQGFETVDVVWAGPSNSGLFDPAQCSLIAVANLTVGLLAYAVDEIPESAEHGILNQSIALVRIQAILLVMGHAIEALAEVHAQLENEEEAITDLIARASAALRQSVAMTVEELADELEVDLEALADALDAAVFRGVLLQETRYQAEDADSACGTSLWRFTRRLANLNGRVMSKIGERLRTGISSRLRHSA